MKFTQNYTVKWHDTDANRVVRPSKIVEYMQETANRQCDAMGLPLDALRDERGLGFILGAMSIHISSPMQAYDSIEVSTWCRPARGYIFERYFDIKREGEIVALASSTWVLLDVDRKKLVRLSPDDDMHDRFPYDDSIDSELLPHKVRIPKDTAMFSVGERRICYSDIDYNMHMNNTHYPDMVCDFLSEMTSSATPLTVTSMSLSYIKEAALGEVLSVERSAKDENGRIFIRTHNRAGDTCLEAAITLSETNR